MEVLPGEAGEPREQRLRIEVTPFKAGDGRLVSQLTASRRYTEPSGIIEQIAAGEDVDANLLFANQARRLPDGESAFLIGGVRLADVRRSDTGIQ